jgi:hypothetical protein
MEMSGQIHSSAALFSEERAPGTHWIGGLVGPITGLADAESRKILPLPSSPYPVTIPTALSQLQ